MPGWAGSSWYWYRYMDANNDKEFASKEAIEYWKDVDLYIGGSEHATGHLLYSRFWNKFMKDLAASIHPGDAVLFVLIKSMTADKVLNESKGAGGVVLKTSLDETKEKMLRDALASAAAAKPAA